MKSIQLKIIGIICLFVLIASCKSAEHYNLQTTKKHNVEALHNDIDYAYKKLLKLHPDIYWYVSEDSLNFAFKDLKESITSPLTSEEFYLKLAPVVSKIRQGHTAVYPPSRKKTKAEKKGPKKRNPFDYLALDVLNNKLFVNEVYNKQVNITKGSELLAINDEEIQFNKYEHLRTGDGFNKTFVKRFSNQNYGYFYTSINRITDSVKLTFRFNDSIYSTKIYSTYKKKKKNDTLNRKIKLSRTEKKIKKEKQKIKHTENSKYAFNKFKQQKVRALSFIGKDSTIGYLKIRKFAGGKKNMKAFYHETFKRMDSLKSNNLIIDLRDNTGGSLEEIDELYSYLSTDDYQFITPSKMTKSTSHLIPFYSNKSTLVKGAMYLLSPVVAVHTLVKVKKLDDEPYYSFKQSKIRSPQDIAFKGNLYVLINENSFSASSILSTNLKGTNRALFVGQETGGAHNGTNGGLFFMKDLPNTKVKLRIGLMIIKAPYTVNPDGYGVIPDVIIQNNQYGEDKQLDWILSKIESNDMAFK